tara:strand:- start:1487 stop:2878 length:1392 start_codon:yes stop_codon:yes gene_type:complete
MKSIFLIATLAFVGINSGSLEGAEFDASSFKFKREIYPAAARDGVGVIRADQDLFLNAADRFIDVRLIKMKEGGWIEWPHLVERVDSGAVKSQARSIPNEVVSFDENEDGSIEIVTRLAKGAPAAATIEIKTPLRDFEKSVRVSGSGDGESWETLIEGTLIFDRQRFVDFRRTKLTLPGNDFRFFKVMISGATDEQRSAVREVTEAVHEQSGVSREERAQVRTRLFRVDGLAFMTAPVHHPAGSGEQAYPIEVESIVENAEKKQTEVTIRAGKTPIRELSLLVDDRNFRREVRVEVPRTDVPDEWRVIESSVVYRYEIGEVREECLSFRMEEYRSDRYRLVISNKDSPPIRVKGVEGRGSIYNMIFISEPGDRFQAFYGSGKNTVKKPSYDVAAIIRARGAGVGQEVFPFGEPMANEAYKKAEVSVRSLFERKWVLWLAIALVVAVLIWALYGTVKRVEDLPQ